VEVRLNPLTGSPIRSQRRRRTSQRMKKLSQRMKNPRKSPLGKFF